jgi:DDE superfamily endonuclease
MNNIGTLLTPAMATYLIGLLYRNTRTSCVSLALLCAHVSHDTLRRVLYTKVPWSRRLWDSFAQGLVQRGGYLVIDDASWERFTRVADAVSWVWSSSVGKPVWGRQVVLLLWTDGRWKVPLGIRLWRKGGPSKVEVAIELLRQARRRGLQPAYILFDSWDAAAQILTLLDGWGWQYVTRLKSNRLLDNKPLRTTWAHRYGQAQGRLRGVSHPVLGVKDGRRYWGTNVLTLTPREVKAQYARRHQIEETFRLLKQELGWGGCSCQKQQAQWAHLHLGLYALVFTQQTAFARGQTIYAFRQSLFLHSIPQNPSALQEFAQAA